MASLSKLLNKPLRSFVLYAMLILAISIPVYFYVVDSIWTSELDEHNALVKEQMVEQLEKYQGDSAQLNDFLRFSNSFTSGTRVQKTEGLIIPFDTTYEITRKRYSLKETEENRFRGLVSRVEIQGLAYTIQVETNFEEADETFLAISLVTAFFFITLVLGFIWLNRRISWKLWKSFYQTLEAIRQFDLSKDKAMRLEPSDIQEFQELNKTLNQLIERSIAAYQQQKAFTENASHELQTPIALLKSRLDLLMQHKEINPELASLIESVERPLARLTHINKSLLLLAKVENKQFAEIEEMDIQHRLKENLELFEDLAADKGMGFQADFDATKTIRANAYLFDTLLQNLLSNAIRHGNKSGIVRVSYEAGHLQIANEGANPLKEENLFERFATASNDRVGTGLGLAIAKEIAFRYGWTLSYKFQGSWHEFSLKF